MSACIDFIERHQGEQRDILLALHELITGFPEVQGKIRFKVPFYDRKTWICYLSPLKTGGVELCFVRANELSNEQGLLDFKDRSQVAGITYAHVRDIQEAPLLEILQEAFLLDDEVPYASKRKVSGK
jgi:hypothetical protein